MGGRCGSKWGRLPGTVLFSQELTPSGTTDTWDPKTAGLEEPLGKELPTRAVCQALKVGIFVNIVITLCFEVGILIPIFYMKIIEAW